VNSTILQTASRFLQPLLLLFSIFVLLRGHNEPGGGFIAGLIAAAAFALYSIAFDAAAARRALRVQPHTLVGVGLLLAATSGLPAVLRGQPFMAAQWAEVSVAGIGVLHVGTPLVFDVGVYSVVIGVTLLILLSLEEE
jgi:multicomponent Na+:H+ antiporter subunit B